MAGSLNQAQLIGHVGKDPDIRTMNSGDKVANFSIATSESWNDKQSGEKKERTQWHNIVVWGKLAEIVEKYVKKGDKLYVSGAIETRKYEKDGRDVYTTEIVLRGFDAKLLMLGSKGERGSDERSGGSYQTASQGGGGGGTQTPVDLDDEIPFASCLPDHRGL